MLAEIHCEKFREKTITFKRGLNVVLGDDAATNSIGKSSLLMVLDFVLGGDSILTHNTDIVDELGHHDYYFKLIFKEKPYYFRRGTHNPELIYSCDSNYNERHPITIEDYRTFLKKSYSLEKIDLTFRSTVSLFSRIWGKENLDVKQPLQSFTKQKPTESIDGLLKLYEKFESIKTLSIRVKSLKEEKTTIGKAFKQRLIPKSTKTKYKENILKKSEIDDEIQDIKQNLAKYAVNIKELVNRKVSELKNRKDRLLKDQVNISSRLERTRDDLTQNRHIKSKSFSTLIQFFPEADSQRISEVEEFHSSITKILKSELKQSEKDLSDALDEINDTIKEIDTEMAKTLSSVENPSSIVDRVHELAKTHTKVSTEIQYFEKEDQISYDLKEAQSDLTNEKRRILKFVQDIINDKTRKLVDKVYSEERRSPTLELSPNSYTFRAIEDTGTGKAYSNLVILDLAIFETTALPLVIHDSVLFKNIENEAVARLISLYMQFEKQSFIAIDEVKKYGKEAEKTLLNNKVIQLSNDRVLFDRDWRI